MGADTGERRGVPFRNLAWAGVALTCVAIAGAAFAYFELLHYRRCAVEHLPPHTEFAARLDVEQIVLFEPVRKQLLPLVDAVPLGNTPLGDAPPAHGAAAAAEDRLARLRGEAGLNLGLDLREILVATADRGRRWVLVVGGLFPRSGLVSAIEETLKAEGSSGWTLTDGALEWTASGVSLGQARDGALILASDRDTLRASLMPSQQFRALGIEREGAGAVALSRAGLSDWLWAGSPVQSLQARMKLGNELEVDVQLEFNDSSSAGAFAERARAATLVSALGPLTTSWGPSPLPTLVDQVKLSGSTLQLVAHVRQMEFERALRDLAAWARRRW